ncbi:MAG: carboxypeptidase-like regulatory domain-containing protein, partial [Flavobacteriaceae bacterium]
MKSNQITFRSFAIILVLFISNLGFAQQEVFVSGQIIDVETKDALENCSVRFYANEKLITGVITDHKGFFELSLNKGQYEMSLDFMSYESQKSTFIIFENNQFLGTFKLKLDDNELGEVVLNASTKSFKIDKNVYSVTKKMKIAAANTNDVLDKISGVTLDRYSNSIKVDGEANVKFLVNGLEKDPEYIQNMNPDRLKNIEITRDPSGKYGLEGYTSVINIILKQDYKGMELSLFDQSIIDSDAKNKAHLLPINNLSVGFNYTYNKINLYSKYSQSLNNLSFPTQIYKTYNDGTRIDQIATLNDSENLKSKELGDNFTLGMDYYINPRHTVSFESKFNNIISNKDNSTIDYLVNEYQNDVLINSSSETQKGDKKSNGNYQSVFYIGKFNDSDQLNLDVTISTSKNNEASSFFENNTFQHTDVSETEQKRFRFNSEFTHDINEKSSVDLGYGFYNLNSENKFNATNYTLKDNRHKLFGYYAIKPNKKLAVKAGIAGEVSTPELSDKKLTYFIYQPYLDVKYNLSKKVDLKLKYRSNSNYPSLNQANPNEV